MLIFATSDKGGTGRSVTSGNVMYRRALQGSDVCYLDFDFGSPTSGAIFEVSAVATGTERGGLHSYLQDRVAEPVRLDLWTESDRQSLRGRPIGAGQLTLFPGDQGGGEFPITDTVKRRCVELFLRVEEEFDVCLIDLSAGRSYAIELALHATGQPELRSTVSRWMIFHRWTRQHIVAASGLVFGDRGILKTGATFGHDAGTLRNSIRFIRTAVLDPAAPELSQVSGPQAAWLQKCNRELNELARGCQLGRSSVLGQTPVDSVLQWREQLISDEDVSASRIANHATIAAFDDIARRLTDDKSWEGL